MDNVGVVDIVVPGGGREGESGPEGIDEVDGRQALGVWLDLGCVVSRLLCC